MDLPAGYILDQSGGLPAGYTIDATSAPETSNGVASGINHDVTNRLISVAKDPSISHIIGQGYGAAGDVVGQAFNAAVPQSYIDASHNAAQAIDSTSSGQKLGDMLLAGKDAVNSAQTNYPKTSQALGDLMNVAAIGGIGEGAIEGAGAKVLQEAPNNSKSFLSNNSSIPFSDKQLPTSADVRGAASESYATANAAGGILKPNITNQFIDNAESVLPQEPRIKTMVGETSSSKIVADLQAWRGTPMTLGETQELDQHLGDLMENNVDPKTGKLDAEGSKILTIQQGLRNSWENATHEDTIGGKIGFDAAKNGRDLWAASAKANDIERIITRAQYMDNPSTGIKTGFRNLVANPARLRGFTNDEVDAIKNAASTGIISNTLRYASSGLVPIIAAATGGGEAGGIGLAVSHAAKTAATNMQINKANQVLAQIMNRPAVQASFNSGAALQATPSLNGPALAALMGGTGAKVNQKGNGQ